MQSRLPFIDATRALFLVQGVVFHSLLPFHEAKQWAISNPESVAGIAALTDWLHSFRMHGFFLISGLLSWRMLCKAGTASFLSSRIQRIAVPFCAVLLTANVIERSMIAQHHKDWGWGFAILDPLYIGALWFLAYLVLFTAALPILRLAVVKSGVMRYVTRCSPNEWDIGLPVLFAVGSVSVVLLTRTSPTWWYSAQLGVIEPAGALMYGGYFMAGALLARTGHVSILSTRPGLVWWVAAVVGWLAIQLVSGASFRGAWLISSVMGNVYAIVPLRLIFWGMSRLFRDGNQWSKALVDASYTVYLLHQVVVVTVASILAWLPWSPLLEIPVIVSAALVLPFTFHSVAVKNSRLLAFMLNGIPLSQTNSPARDRLPAAAA